MAKMMIHYQIFWSFCIQDSVTLCTLGVGTAFGESILDDQPRHATVVTNEYCELLRIEQKDFRVLWEVSLILQDLFALIRSLFILKLPSKQRSL